MEKELKALFNQLVILVAEAVPTAQSSTKYGGTIFTLKPDEKEGQFCGVFPYKTHVQLSFSKGTLLDSAEFKLEGSGKFRRHLNFKAANKIDEKALKKLIVQSSAL